MISRLWGVPCLMTLCFGLGGCSSILGLDQDYQEGAADQAGQGGGSAGSSEGGASGKSGDPQGGAGQGGAPAGGSGSDPGGTGGLAGSGGEAGAGGAGTAGTSGQGGQGGQAGAGGVGGASGVAGAGASGAPATCGNKALDAGEDCDGSLLGGNSCATATGKVSTGALACTPLCTFDLSGCHFCGDGIKGGQEFCDGPDLGGASCATAVSPDSTGTLTCKKNCTFDVGECSAPKTCGNGVKDAAEKCEGTDFGSATCSSAIGTTASGSLACTAQCTLDTSKCSFCGDGEIGGMEACDGPALGAATCASATKSPGALGTLSCTSACQLDTTDCTFCGNGKHEAGEACDGADLNGATCSTVIMSTASGSLGCSALCGFDTSGCQWCGDGKTNNAEACDSADLGGATCASVVGVGSVGTLKCTASCGFDLSGCTAPAGCGDLVKNGSEQCDSQDLGGTSCATALGRPGATGSISCTATCTFDTTQCQSCGDGLLNNGEPCDGVQLQGADCAAVTGEPATLGTLKCAADCSDYDLSGCYYCGDGRKNGSDKCDGMDLGGATCASVTGISGASGTLGCSPSCAFDVAGCIYCGDGFLNNGEACDGADFGGATCDSLVGFGSTGALKCANGCGMIDTSGCSAAITCGDGQVSSMAGEDCDGMIPVGTSTTCATATNQPSASGTLGCSNNCKYDLSACKYCGNNIKDGSEACDGTDLSGAACLMGYTGTPQCTSDCKLDNSTCLCTSPRIVCDTGSTTACLDPATDPLNCGFCGHSCLGGSCSKGICAATQLPTNGSFYTFLVNNGVIYVAGMAGSPTMPFLRKEDTAGNNPITLTMTPSMIGPRFLAADATNVYVAASGSSDNQFKIVQVAKSNGAGLVLGSSGASSIVPIGFCLAGSSLFLTGFDLLKNKSTIHLTGPGITTASLLFSVDSTSIFHGAACVPEKIFFGRNDASPYQIQAESTMGGAPVGLLDSQQNVGEISLTGTTLVWSILNTASTVAGAAGIHKMQTDGTGHKQIFSTTKAYPSSVVADAKGIYWSDSAAGSINYLSLDGTVKRVAASPTGNIPANLQLDAQYLYFMTNATFASAAIYRVPR